jgi:glyoxylase-like metal-dependent hydrolase (beta-lactamase superfamily II)
MAHFRQLRDEATGAFSYLIGCERTNAALIIDPVANQTPLYLGMLGELGLLLEWILETHLHADHITAADSLREWTNARIAVSAQAGIDSSDRLLADGDTLACGDIALVALATPGHTPGCLSYLWGDRLFTGDSLLIGACGRIDEPGSDGTRLYDSVTRRLFAQPDETLVYPGHCLAGRRVSSIGEEREKNPLFHGASRDSFATLKNNDLLPSVLPIALEANRHCGRLLKTEVAGAMRTGAIRAQRPCATNFS